MKRSKTLSVDSWALKDALPSKNEISNSLQELGRAHRVVELNFVKNLPCDGGENDKLKKLVATYETIRNKCLDFSQVREMLALNPDDYKDEFDLDDFNGLTMSSNNNPIGRDLEKRARDKTVENLRRQTEQYRKFNSELPFLMEPDK